MLTSPMICNDFVRSLVPSLRTKLCGKEFQRMTWEEVIIKFLPDMIKELTPKEITNEFVKALQRPHRAYTQNDAPRVAWILFVCTEWMRTDVEFQSRIAHILFCERDDDDATTTTQQEVEDFVQRYQFAATIMPSTLTLSPALVQRFQQEAHLHLHHFYVYS